MSMVGGREGQYEADTVGWERQSARAKGQRAKGKGKGRWGILKCFGYALTYVVINKEDAKSALKAYQPISKFIIRGFKLRKHHNWGRSRY